MISADLIPDQPLSTRLFLDIEASSLTLRSSYPIEIGVADDMLRVVDSFLVAPIPDWTDWSEASEQLHGLDRRRLLREGIAPREAVSRLQALGATTLYSDQNARHDAFWLTRLFEAAGCEQTILVRSFLDGGFGGDALSLDRADGGAELDRLVAAVFPHPHRAAPDAVHLAARWRVREDAVFRARVRSAAIRATSKVRPAR